MTFTVSPGRMMPGRSTQPTSPRFLHAAFTKWLVSFSRSGWWAWMTLPGPMHASFSRSTTKVASSGKKRRVPGGSSVSRGMPASSRLAPSHAASTCGNSSAPAMSELLGGHQRHLPRIADGHAPRKPLHAHVRRPREALVVVSSEALPRHLHLGDVAGDEVRGLGADEDTDGAAGEVRGHGGTVTSRRQKA